MRRQKTDVRRENTDVRWVGFHPLQNLTQFIWQVCGGDGEGLGLEPVHNLASLSAGIPRGDNSGGSNNSHSSSAHFKQYVTTPAKSNSAQGIAAGLPNSAVANNNSNNFTFLSNQVSVINQTIATVVISASRQKADAFESDILFQPYLISESRLDLLP
jgi:hypothetical protein